LKQYLWKDQGACVGLDTNLFFDSYEEDETIRPVIDSICGRCPVSNKCFANGISGKEWGVWGGVYLEGGDISREFNKHKKKDDWANTWKSLTIG
jgi:hypothetical protein